MYFQDTILAVNMIQTRLNVHLKSLMEGNLSCILHLLVDNGKTTRYIYLYVWTSMFNVDISSTLKVRGSLMAYYYQC